MSKVLKTSQFGSEFQITEHMKHFPAFPGRKISVYFNIVL